MYMGIEENRVEIVLIMILLAVFFRCVAWAVMVLRLKQQEKLVEDIRSGSIARRKSLASSKLEEIALVASASIKDGAGFLDIKIEAKKQGKSDLEAEQSEESSNQNAKASPDAEDRWAGLGKLWTIADEPDQMLELPVPNQQDRMLESPILDEQDQKLESPILDEQDQKLESPITTKIVDCTEDSDSSKVNSTEKSTPSASIWCPKGGRRSLGTLPALVEKNGSQTPSPGEASPPLSCAVLQEMPPESSDSKLNSDI